MAPKSIHLDPASILALPYLQTPNRKHAFIAHLGQLATRLWQSRNSVSLVFCEDHYVELLQQFAGGEYYAGRARHAKQLLIRYFGVRQCARHSYGDSGLESRIIDSLNDSLNLGDGDVVVAWADFLASDLLIDRGSCAPGYTQPSFALVPNNTLNVLVGDQTRSFPFFSSWGALINHLQIVAPETLAAIVVDSDPTFVWEKTGHGASKYQERVVVRTARESSVVIRSGTIYQNPQGDIKTSSIAATDDTSEFRFTVVDGDNVLRGIYKTKATTEQQSKLALLAIRHGLDKALAAG